MSAETDLQTAAGKLLKLAYDTDVFAAGTFTTDESAAVSGAITDASPAPQQVAKAFHEVVFGTRPFYGSALAAYMPALARIKGYPETDPLSIFTRYFHDVSAAASVTVKSRQMTIGAVSAGGSNVGNGTVIRLSTDRYGNPIENGSAEAKSWTCVQDEHNGAPRWQEVFTLRGTAPATSVMPFPGQGSIIENVHALSIADSAQFIQNPGFESYDSTNKFTGWKSSVDGTTMSNWTQDTARYFRDVLPNSTPAAAIQAVGTTDYLYQTWSDRAVKWSPDVPLFAQVAYMRRSSATGTLVLQIGDQSTSVDIATKTNDEWNVLRFPVTSAAWFRSFNASNPGTSTNPFIKVGVTSLAVGTCLIDEVIVAPYTFFDGTWCAIVPGPSNSATTAGPSVPFLRDDVFTATDSQGAVGKLQIALAKAGGFYLPSVSDGSQTWADF